MFKRITIVLGFFFLAIGILGFIPTFTPMGHLFGIFHVNNANNILHLAIGLVGLWIGYFFSRASQLFLQVLGILFFILAVMGFILGHCYMLETFANNLADSIASLVIAIFCLYFGFWHRKKSRIRR
jgi:hypothetical protein